MGFHLGCAIWAYKGWVGDLFPAKSRSADFLSLYSRRFTSVEGNTTFYSTPTPATVDRWAAQTPPGFKFCPKLPKRLTHHGRLQPALPEALAFLELMQRFGDRLGPLFLQLPPQYSPEYWDDLLAFLTGWSKTQVPIALEVRHLAWFQPPYADRLNETLQELKLGRVLLDTRPIYDCPDDPQVLSERKKPKVPLDPIVTASFSLVRFISHPDLSQNQSYLAQWVTTIDRWLQAGIEVYFFVHCPIEARSPQIARHFQHCLEQQGASVPPLPWDNLAWDELGTDPASPGAQLKLF